MNEQERHEQLMAEFVEVGERIVADERKVEEGTAEEATRYFLEQNYKRYWQLHEILWPTH